MEIVDTVDPSLETVDTVDPSLDTVDTVETVDTVDALYHNDSYIAAVDNYSLHLQRTIFDHAEIYD